jgi:CheY-like chemotaxis protein
MPNGPLPTVFVVDDEPVIASTVAEILNMSGFNAADFNDAADALQAAETGCPDLLITDVSMRGMNGIELAIRFGSAYPNCKILLFSGHTASGGLLDAAKGQGHHFTILAKPVHPKELLAAIKGIQSKPSF